MALAKRMPSLDERSRPQRMEEERKSMARQEPECQQNQRSQNENNMRNAEQHWDQQMSDQKLSLLHPGSTCQLKRAAHRARHFEKTVDTFKLEFTCTRRSTPVAVQPQVIGTLGFQLPKDTVVLKILPHTCQWQPPKKTLSNLTPGP